MARRGAEVADTSSSKPMLKYSPQFVLPSKAKSIISIIAPPETSQHLETVDSVPLVSHERRSAVETPAQVSVQKSNVKELISDSELTRTEEPGRSNIQSRQIITTGAIDGSYRHGDINSQTSDSSSGLDIFAPSYIPLWLLAINDSAATTSKSLALDSIDLPKYTHSFAGHDFVRPHTPVELPPIMPSLNQIQAKELCVENYELHFKNALQNEISAQAAELRVFYLYNVPLQVENPAKHLFRLSVPGLRENAPLIDLGDVVMIRPLINVIERQATTDARVWYDSGARNSGILAPGFEGYEYHAVVWGVSKQQEVILLRIDGSPPIFRKCNAIFVVQAHRCIPLFHGLKFTTSALRNSEYSNSSWLRSILFPDKVDARIQSNLSRGVFHLQWFNETLNYEQRKAVNSIVQEDYGHVPYLISGPPGTGKTSTIVETALQLLKASKFEDPHLLVCSPSQSSADTLAIRLAVHLTPSELFRLNTWTRSFAEVPESLLPYCFIHKDLFSMPNFRTMMSYKVVVTTCRDADMLLQAQLSNQSLRSVFADIVSAFQPSISSNCDRYVHWHGLLLDEAAQATEPEALIPIAVVDPGRYNGSEDCASNAIVPLVAMAGDEFQLGPRLSLKHDNPLNMSLFERLFKRALYAEHPLSRAHGLKPLMASMLPILRPAFTNLIRNYRSHPTILAVPSALFYHDTLIPENIQNSEVVRTWPGWKAPMNYPVLFKQNSASDDVESILAGSGTGSGSLINAGEAKMALNIVRNLLEHSTRNQMPEPLLPEEIVVMSPFRAQVKLLRMTFRDASLTRVNIGPLESFQGLESRIVILCTTRTRLGPEGQKQRFVREDQNRGLGLIDEAKRFNVAMTRAKEGLIVIGDPRCLVCTGDRNWTSFIAFCRRNGCVEDNIELSEIYAADIGVGRLERALKYAHRQRRGEAGLRASNLVLGAKQRPRLKGTMMNTDELMWVRGMENIDPNFALEEESSQHESDHAGSEENLQGNFNTDMARNQLLHIAVNGESMDEPPGKNRDSSLGVEVFDRDLVSEFEKADCATQ